MSDHRSCTCHPDEAPIPCQRGYALNVCQMRAVRTANEEIINLRADNERLRAALRQVAAYKADDDEMDWADAVLTMNAIARAALEEKPNDKA